MKRPTELFRYFEEEVHRDNLCEKGSILISTLSSCREYKDSEKGDSEEGISTFENKEKIIGNSKDKKVIEETRRMGIILEDCGTGVFQNNIVTNYIDDSFLLCLTTESDKDILKGGFGEYGVRILNVEKFQSIINEALCKKFNLKDLVWRRGSVQYGQRNLSYDRKSSILPHFQKPDEYSYQKEYRLVWEPTINKELKVNKVILDCPEIVQFVEKH